MIVRGQGNLTQRRISKGRPRKRWRLGLASSRVDVCLSCNVEDSCHQWSDPAISVGLASKVWHWFLSCNPGSYNHKTGKDLRGGLFSLSPPSECWTPPLHFLWHQDTHQVLSYPHISPICSMPLPWSKPPSPMPGNHSVADANVCLLTTELAPFVGTCTQWFSQQFWIVIYVSEVGKLKHEKYSVIIQGCTGSQLWYWDSNIDMAPKSVPFLCVSISKYWYCLLCPYLLPVPVVPGYSRTKKCLSRLGPTINTTCVHSLIPHYFFIRNKHSTNLMYSLFNSQVSSGPRLTIHSLAEPYLPAPSLSHVSSPRPLCPQDWRVLPCTPVVCPICPQYVALGKQPAILSCVFAPFRLDP